MQSYEELLKLARIYARRAHEAQSDDEAAELWRMALNYRSRAADFAAGDLPELGVMEPVTSERV